MRLSTVFFSAVGTAATLVATDAQSTPIKISGFGFKQLAFNGATLCGVDKGDHIHCAPYDPNNGADAKLKWSQKGPGKLKHIVVDGKVMYGLNGLHELYHVEFPDANLQGNGTWKKIATKVQSFGFIPFVQSYRTDSEDLKAELLVVGQKDGPVKLQKDVEFSTVNPFVTVGDKSLAIKKVVGHLRDDFYYWSAMIVYRYFVALDEGGNSWLNGKNGWTQIPTEERTFRELVADGERICGITSTNDVYCGTTEFETECSEWGECWKTGAVLTKKWYQLKEKLVYASVYENFLFGTTATKPIQNNLITIQ